MTENVNKQYRTIPELLAPAGGMEQLKAAVQNGADAIYLGGSLFNARINASNFEEEEMIEAVSYAHLRRVKLYVTMNTLIRDEELVEAVEYARSLYEIGIDALIIQDLGLGKVIKKVLPKMQLHFSTQGSIYNLSGVQAAAQMGFKRVVLARELGLEEIADINKDAKAETEVFVHGALCFCYSGQCQLSRVNGGRSSNRGLCAQPCRLPYEEQGYAISPKDLCTVDFLGELCKAGVSSLKIEGRMKSPEYVAIVTGIYRKYLDIYKENGSYTVSEVDKRSLAQIFNRGGFTEGYIKTNPKESLITTKLSKHQGIYIGEVINIPKEQGLIDIRVVEGETLSMGDGVEIRSKELTGNIVTYIKKSDSQGTLRIGDFKGKVFRGDEIYRISQKVLMESAKASWISKAAVDGENVKKHPISIKFEAKIGKISSIEVSSDKIKIIVEGEKLCERAIKRATDEETVRAQLSKTGEYTFEIKNMDISLEEGIMLPLSEINAVRRKAFELLEEKLKGGRTLTKEEMKCFVEECKEIRRATNILNLDSKAQRPGLRLYFYEGERGLNFKYGEFVKDLPSLGVDITVMVPLYDFAENTQEFIDLETKFKFVKVIPYVRNISKGALDNYIYSNFKSLVEKLKKTGVFLGNLGWIKEFQSEGVRIHGDYGLNLYNQSALALAEDLGILDAVMSHETYKNQDNEGNKNVKYYGAFPVMISEHPMKPCEIRDRKGKSFLVIWEDFEKKSIIVENTKLDEIKLEDVSKTLSTMEQTVVIYII